MRRLALLGDLSDHLVLDPARAIARQRPDGLPTYRVGVDAPEAVELRAERYPQKSGDLGAYVTRASKPSS